MSEKSKADDLLNFESKKKKKTKVPVLDTPAESANPQETLDFGVKKKKKVRLLTEDGNEQKPIAGSNNITEEPKKLKKKPVDADSINQLSEKLDDELSFTSKKKKSKSKVLLPDEDLKITTTGEATEAVTTESGDDPGFTYDMLLSRVFAQLGALNPELASDQKRRLVMVPPQMARIGSKKTLFVNFATICRSLNREQSHLTTYILAELGTQGSVDANGALLIRGRYQSKHMELVLRNYCRNYVLCGTCQSSETELCKDSRLLFLHCRRCGSRFTVKSVTSGFQALTGKRAAIRAKTQ